MFAIDKKSAFNDHYIAVKRLISSRLDTVVARFLEDRDGQRKCLGAL